MATVALAPRQATVAGRVAAWAAGVSAGLISLIVMLHLPDFLNSSTMWLVEQYPAYDKRDDVLPRWHRPSLDRARRAGRRPCRRDQLIQGRERQVGLAHLKNQRELDRPGRARAEQTRLPGSAEERFQWLIAVAGILRQDLGECAPAGSHLPGHDPDQAWMLGQVIKGGADRRFEAGSKRLRVGGSRFIGQQRAEHPRLQL